MSEPCLKKLRAECDSDSDEFARCGYAVLRGVLSLDLVRALRDEANELALAAFDSLLQRGCVLEPMEALREQFADKPCACADTGLVQYRRLRDSQAGLDPRVALGVLGEGSALVERVLGVCLGAFDTYHLFNEQYLIKPSAASVAEPAKTRFGAHTDDEGLPEHVQGGGVGYVSVWCPLDEMSRENGCLWVLPKGSVGVATAADAAGTVGGAVVDGLDGLVDVLVSPGDVVVLSSSVVHGSHPNTSHNLRRAYMPQFSTTPIRTQDGKELICWAVPVRSRNASTPAEDDMS